MKCKHKPCHNKVKKGQSFCSKRCYSANRYRTDPKFRKKKIELSKKWIDENPEKYIESKRKANKKWRQRNPQKISNLVNAWQKKRRAERINKGLCSNCGGKREDKTWLQCVKCRKEGRK